MKNAIIIISKIDTAPSSNRSLRHALQSERARQLIAPACTLLDDENTSGWRLSQDSPPQLLQADGQPAPYWISLSHSDSWAGCLLSQAGPAGFDLESCQEREFATLLDYLATAREQRWLKKHFGDQASARFYACWTLKEAIGKLYRAGWDASTAQLDLTALDTRDADGTTLQASHQFLPDAQLALSSAVRSATPISPRLYLMSQSGALSAVATETRWHNH
jgi:hypothetical protein